MASVVEVHGFNESLGPTLLEGKLLSYHDENYEMTAGKHELLMRLYRDNTRFAIYYIQVPHAYNIPSLLQQDLKKLLESAVNKAIPEIEFINVGIEKQKRNINFTIGWGANQ